MIEFSLKPKLFIFFLEGLSIAWSSGRIQPWMQIQMTVTVDSLNALFGFNPSIVKVQCL